MPPSMVETRALLRTVAEDAFDAGLRRSMLVHRLRTDVANDVVKTLNSEMFPAVVKTLNARMKRIKERGVDLGPATTKRLQRMAAEIDGVVAGSMRSAKIVLDNRLLEAAVSEATWQTRVLKATHAPFNLGIDAPNLPVLRELVKNTPVRGRLVRSWFDDLGKSTQAAVVSQINIGMAQGETAARIARRLTGVGGVFQKTRTQVITIASTSITDTMAKARERTYMENAQVVSKVQYVATLDARTTEVCSGLDGKTFDVGDGPRPPQHFNCRSTTVPVTKSWAELGFEGGSTPEGTRAQTAATPADKAKWKGMTPLQRATYKAKLSGQVPAKTTRQTWLQQQPESVQVAALGKKKAALFKSGQLDFRGMVDVNGSPLSASAIDARGVAMDRAAALASLSLEQKKSEMLWRVDALIEAKASGDTKKFNSLRSQLHNIDKSWLTFAKEHGYVAKGGGKFKAPSGYVKPPLSYTKPPVLSSKKTKTKKVPTASPEVAAPPSPQPTTVASPAPAPAPRAPKVGDDLVEFDMRESSLTRIGSKPGGSNPGYLARDEAGDSWVVKKPKGDELARNEVLAARLYQASGADVPTVRLVKMDDGSLGVASKVRQDVFQNKAVLTAGQESSIFEHFATDAFLGNWDVVGASYDNMLVKTGGGVLRIDTGGALRFRAQGAPKGSAFGDAVLEIDTLRSPSNPSASAVFAKMTDAQLLKSMTHTLDNLSSSTIDELIQKYGPANAADRASLRTTMANRRADLQQRRDKLAAKINADKVAAEKLAKDAASGKLPESTAFPTKFEPVAARLHDDTKRPRVSNKDEFLTKWNGWVNGLQKAEGEAIRRWKSSSSWVRRHMALGELPKEAKAVDTFTSALEKSPASLPQRLYRGLRVSVSEAEALMRPGYEFELTSHASFSKSRIIGDRFGGRVSLTEARQAGKLSGGKSSRSKVSVKLEVENGSGTDIHFMHGYTNEQEIVGLAGTRYRVVGTQDVPGRGFVVTLRQVNNLGDAPSSKPSKPTAASAAPAAPKSGPVALSDLRAAIDSGKTWKDLQTVVEQASETLPSLKNTKVTMAGMTVQSAKLLVRRLIDTLEELGDAAPTVKKIGVTSGLKNGQIAMTRITKNASGKSSIELLFDRDTFTSNKKISAVMRQQASSGWLAGDSVEHLINHELGHVVREANRQATQRAIDYANNNLSTLSKYAATDTNEALSEAWGVIMTEPGNKWGVLNIPSDPWLRGMAEALGDGFKSHNVKMPDQLKRFLEAAKT